MSRGSRENTCGRFRASLSVGMTTLTVGCDGCSPPPAPGRRRRRKATTESRSPHAAPRPSASRSSPPQTTRIPLAQANSLLRNHGIHQVRRSLSSGRNCVKEVKIIHPMAYWPAKRSGAEGSRRRKSLQYAAIPRPSSRFTATSWAIQSSGRARSYSSSSEIKAGCGPWRSASAKSSRKSHGIRTHRPVSSAMTCSIARRGRNATSPWGAADQPLH